MKKHHSYLEERIRQTGWIARQFLKLRLGLQKVERGYRYRGTNQLRKAYFWCLAQIVKHRIVKAVFNFLYVYNFIGSLTGYDQKVYSAISKGKVTPKKITIVNSLVFGFIMTGYYYGVLMLLEYISGNIHAIQSVMRHLSYSVIAILLIELTWDVYRIVFALITDEGKEPVGFVPLILNGPTYIKRCLKG